MNDHDRELRDMFARLKDEDHAHTPPFRTPTWTAAQPWRLTRLAVAAAIVLVALVLARPDGPPRNVGGQLVHTRAATWRSPTDFLLVTPGSELMRTVPEVGQPDLWGRILRNRSPVPESTRS
jgi:hypothetical protein